MSTKLVKLDVPEPLHRRIKTIAASKDKKISDYMLDVLEEHVPKYITFSSEGAGDEQSRKQGSKTKAKSNIN
jgi:hypothetical protein